MFIRARSQIRFSSCGGVGAPYGRQVAGQHFRQVTFVIYEQCSYPDPHTMLDHIRSKISIYFRESTVRLDGASAYLIATGFQNLKECTGFRSR